MTEQQLVEATLCGDGAAFGELAGRYARVLVVSARRFTGNAEDAEDLAMETLVAAWRKLSTLRDPGKFRAWLMGILRLTCLDYLRRRQPEMLNIDDQPEIVAPMPAEFHDIGALLDQLPLTHREIILLRYLQELSYAEIAELLTISEEAARMRCQRARERLRALASERDEAQLRQALAGLLAVPLSEDFMTRVLEGVAVMGTAGKVTVGAAGAAGLWKILARVALIAVLAVGGVLWMLHARGGEGKGAAGKPWRVALSNGGTLELVGVNDAVIDRTPIPTRPTWVSAKPDRNTWWYPDGTLGVPAPRSDVGGVSGEITEESSRRYRFLYLRYHRPSSSSPASPLDAPQIRVRCSGIRGSDSNWSGGPPLSPGVYEYQDTIYNGATNTKLFGLLPGSIFPETVQLDVDVADGPLVTRWSLDRKDWVTGKTYTFPSPQGTITVKIRSFDTKGLSYELEDPIMGDPTMACTWRMEREGDKPWIQGVNSHGKIEQTFYERHGIKLKRLTFYARPIVSGSFSGVRLHPKR